MEHSKELEEYNNALRELRDKMKDSIILSQQVVMKFNGLDIRSVSQMFYWVNANHYLSHLIQNK